MIFALILVAVAVGAIAQRVTGMGFALTASPFLVLLLGPFDGVLIANLCGAVSAALILTRVWRQVDWRRYGLLVVPALLGILPAAWLTTVLPGAALEIGIAVLLIVALTASLLVARARITVSGAPPALVAGFTSGFMNAAAGVGGPAISAYAVLTRWPQERFAATMQPFLVTVATSSLVSKLLFSHGQLPALDAWKWVTIIGALLGGLAIGELVGRRISSAGARRAVIVLAYLGGAVALIHGIVDAMNGV